MIGWRDGDGGVHRGTLFAVFAALARGDAWSFPALRAHQREAWHAFTVQVAAMALIHAGRDDLPQGEAAWRDLLLALTPGQPDGAAWELVVDDWTRPALLQSPLAAPVTPADRAAYKSVLPTPDVLDTLITAKNHDVKQERIAEAGDEDWLFALVTLQTTEGYSGAGNFGISRMNGGFATRMSLGVRPTRGGAAAAFVRDVHRLVADARSRPDRREGLELLWTVAWDGTQALGYNELDELYVEVCRRVRLRRTSGGIEAVAVGSKCARVAAGELKGRTRDPWAPLKADGETSHTPTGAGFGYRQMAHLLDSGKIARPLLAQKVAADDREGLSIVAAALVRGQGKTEGLHRRAVRIHHIHGDESVSDGTIDRMGRVAQQRADEASEAGRRLRRALISLVQGGPEQARFDDDAAKKKTVPWLDRFNLRVDRVFFAPPFWGEVAGDPDNHRLAWRQMLHALADEVFDEAVAGAPRTAMRRERAEARARTMLGGQMNKWVQEVVHGE